MILDSSESFRKIGHDYFRIAGHVIGIIGHTFSESAVTLRRNMHNSSTPPLNSRRHGRLQAHSIHGAVRIAQPAGFDSDEETDSGVGNIFDEEARAKRESPTYSYLPSNVYYGS